MSLVQDHVVPLLSPQHRCVFEGKGIRSNADVEVKFVVPPSAKLLSTFGIAIVAEDLEPREELLKLHFPIQDDTSWNDDQMRTPYPSVSGEVSKQSDRLNRLSQA